MKSDRQIVSSSPKADDSVQSVESTTSSSSAVHRLYRKLSPKQSPERFSDSTNSGGNPEVLLEQVFNYFDENGDGKISPEELQSCAKTVGGELSREEAEMAVQLSDSDDDGMLSLKEFTELVDGSKVSEEERKDELKEAFGMYAGEGKDCITPKSLKKMLSRLGESSSLKTCENMISKFDINGDGVLSFEEFRNMMK